MRIAFATLSLLAGFTMPVMAADQIEKAPLSGAYKKVSELVKLPDFLLGLGQLYVDPKTLPAGPFLAFDREGRLVSTVYMLPIENLSNKDKRFDDLPALGGKVDHVDVYFNAGHQASRSPVRMLSCGTSPRPTSSGWLRSGGLMQAHPTDRWVCPRRSGMPPAPARR